MMFFVIVKHFKKQVTNDFYLMYIQKNSDWPTKESAGVEVVSHSGDGHQPPPRGHSGGCVDY